jgi:hypothetical protein
VYAEPTTVTRYLAPFCRVSGLKGLFMNFLKTKKRNPPKKEDFLKKALLEAQKNFEDAYNGLQDVNDPDLIDSYIYAINAATLRYKVLLHEVKTASNDNSSTSHRKEA